MYECVQCGYCCRVGICKHGEWDSVNEKCSFLTNDNLCGIFEKIKDDEDIGFGIGCSSPLFNTYRQNKIKGKKCKNY